MTELVAAQQKRIATLEEEMAVMARQIMALIRYIFGGRSEQTPPPVPGQSDLHLETESGGESPAPPATPDKSKGGSRRGRKIHAQRLAAHLAVKETVLTNSLVAADPGDWPGYV